MWISLEQIQCLQVVIETGSLSAASIKLNKAKSAVSYSVNRLEEELGFRLFHRGKYRLETTRRGREFVEKSTGLLKEVEQLKYFAEQLRSGVELTLSISCSELFPLSTFNEILKKLVKKFPDTELRFQREILSGAKILKGGQVDVAIFEGQYEESKYEGKEVARVMMKLVISANHPFLDLPESQQNLEALLKYPQIVQRSTLPDEESHGVHERATKWFVTDTHTKKQIILDALGWGRLPDHDAEASLKSGKLVHLGELGQDHEATVNIVRQKLVAHGAVSSYLWELF